MRGTLFKPLNMVQLSEAQKTNFDKVEHCPSHSKQWLFRCHLVAGPNFSSGESNAIYIYQIEDS